MGRLFLYHLRLAALSLRRDPGLSAAIVGGMVVAACMWTLTAVHYVRSHTPPVDYSPAQWETAMLHMRIRANLTAEEHKKILSFLQDGN